MTEKLRSQRVKRHQNVGSSCALFKAFGMSKMTSLSDNMTNVYVTGQNKVQGRVVQSRVKLTQGQCEI